MRAASISAPAGADLFARNDVPPSKAARPRSGSTLLTYRGSTDPSPVQVSAASAEPSIMSLTIVVSCSPVVGSATVAQIDVTIPVDDVTLPPDATNLAAVAPETASLVSSDNSIWIVTPDPLPGLFHISPQSGTASVSEQGLTITVPGIQVNAIAGTATITIDEWASQSGTTPPIDGPASASSALEVSKFPAGFTVDRFEAAPPIAVGPDYGTTLSWSGSAGATYTILYGDVIVPDPGDPMAPPLPPHGSLAVDDLMDDPTVFTLAVSAQVNGATIHTERQAVVTVERARIDRFTIFPPVLERGQTCEVRWATNGDTCFIGNQEALPPSGVTNMTFDVSTGLTLSAKKGSDLAQQTAFVTVAPQVIDSFTATVNGAPIDGAIDIGTAVLLAWSTRNASTVTLSPGVPGSQPASGSVIVTPTTDMTYVLTCAGAAPDISASLPVIIKSTSGTLRVKPDSIDPGGSATLTWTTAYATSATIYPAVGAVTPVAGGSVVVTPGPQQDTLYTLIVEGSNPARYEATALLTVRSPRIIEFAFTNLGFEGAALVGTVNWTTERATGATLSCNRPNDVYTRGAVPTTGSLDFQYNSPDQPIAFTLTVTGRGATQVKTISTTL